MTRQRALQMIEKPDSNAEKRTIAAEVMRTLGLVANVADLAGSVLQETSATPGQLQRAAEAWLAALGETAVPEIAALATARPPHDHAGRARLAAFLHKAGDEQTAESLAVAVLDDEKADGDAVVEAVTTVLSVCGERPCRGCSPWWTAGPPCGKCGTRPGCSNSSQLIPKPRWCPGSAPYLETGFLTMSARATSSRHGWP
jgi:hypothetical protein